MDGNITQDASTRGTAVATFHPAFTYPSTDGKSASEILNNKAQRDRNQSTGLYSQRLGRELGKVGDLPADSGL